MLRRGGTPGLTNSRCRCSCRMISQCTPATLQFKTSRQCGQRSPCLALKNLRRVVGIDFHEIRTQFHASGMWGRVTPNWDHFKYHQEAVGPGCYTEAELEEKLFVNRSNRCGDDTKDAILGKEEWRAWDQWKAEAKRFSQLRQRAQLSSFLPKVKCWHMSLQESSKMKFTFSYTIFSHRMM